MDPDPTYTVEEARALLPEIRGTLLQLAIERRRADEHHAALHRRASDETNGAPPDPELEAAAAQRRAAVRALLDHLESLGVVLRDMQAGLVDIPTIRDGVPAWLCWRLADPDLGWWHGTQEGFTSRRPL